jgi:formate dehydrogenase
LHPSSVVAVGAGVADTIFTFCRICEARCGLEVTVERDQVVRIAPDKENPHSWRDYCAKGRTAAEVVRHERRILTPLRRVGDRYVEASWDDAIADIAGRLRKIFDTDGPDAIGTYWGNPMGWSETNHLMRDAFLDSIGTGQRYSSASVDQNNLVYVCNEMYGIGRLFLIPDVDGARCIMLVGTNPAVSAFNWSCSVPDGWRRVLAAQRTGADVIVVDPRRTETAAAANTHVVVRPGQDWAFLLGILTVILAEGWIDTDDATDADGLDLLMDLVGEVDLQRLATICDVPVTVIVDIAKRFAQAPTGFCFTATGVSHHTTGAVGEWLGQVINVVTGRLDRPGGRYMQRSFVDLARFNAKLKRPTHRPSRVRGLPPIKGTHALAELADEITTPGDGRIRAMIIQGGNPVVAGPDGQSLDAALAQLDLLVAVDLVQRESHRHAHWLLPAPHWLERDDLLLSFAASSDEPFVQYGARAVPPPPDVREEWELFVDLAIAMRRPLFGRRGVNTAIRATRLLARITRSPKLAFHPRWHTRLAVAHGRTLRWRDIVDRPHGWVWADREYGQLRADLALREHRIQLAPTPLLARVRELLAAPVPTAPDAYAFMLINKRAKNMMNSWLSEIPDLHRHPGSDVEMNPVDAEHVGVDDGDLVHVASATGAVDVAVVVSEKVPPGVVAIGHGWGSRTFDPHGGNAPSVVGVDRNRLVSDLDIDPLSQIPALNSTFVSVTRVDPACDSPSEPG